MERTAQPREPRVIARCRIEFDRIDRKVVAETEDLSRRGVFVRTEHLLPVGAELELELTLPDGERFYIVARVAHLLSPSAARALGRQVGMGLEFLAAGADSGASLAQYLDDLIEDLTPTPPPATGRLRLVVVEASAPLRARLTNALQPAGFVIEACADAVAAHAACAARPPAGVVLATTPGADPLALVRALAVQPRLARIPVVIVSDDPSDLTRLEAFRLGVHDYLSRPFLDEELVIRVGRTVARAGEAAMLRGDLTEISVATLLTLFELERKSGVLAVSAGTRTARLAIRDGRVVAVEGGSRSRVVRERLMAVLDLDRGRFAFTGGDIASPDQLGLSTTQILLEHARARDEAAARPPPVRSIG